MSSQRGASPESPPEASADDHEDDRRYDAEDHKPLLPPEDGPMPWRQLLVLVFMRLSEPIAFTQIFPYVNRMMLDIGATDSPAQVGFYGGLIESLFALTQLMTVLAWGSASDRYGRKPIMLIGLTGTTISQLAFGLSKSFWWAVAARCTAGALNGNVAIIKSLLGELVPQKRQARAFSFLPLCWAIGCTIGPLLGGYLSNPAEQYDLFAEGGALYLNGLWVEYPYLLPCAVAASSTATSMILGSLFLEETLPRIIAQRRRKQMDAAIDDDASTRPLLGSRRSSYGAVDASPQSTPAARSSNDLLRQSIHNSLAADGAKANGRHGPRLGRVQSWASGFTPHDSRAASSSTSRAPSPDRGHRPPDRLPSDEAEAPRSGVRDLLFVAHIRRVLLSYAFLALSAVAIDAVLVLYLYEPIPLGGLSFTSQQTGTLLFLSGAGSIVVQLLLFPYLQEKVGTLRLYRLALLCFPVVACTLPIGNLIAQSTGVPDLPSGAFSQLPRETQVLVWAVILFSSVFRVLSSMAFSCNMLLVNQSGRLVPGAPLGTLNGLAQMSSSVMRAAGPYGASSLFAFSVTHQILGGKLVWPVIALSGLIGAIITRRLRDIEREYRLYGE